MTDPDPVTTGLVVAGVLQVTKQAETFIAAACGHPGESIGTMVGNFTHRRLKNLETVTAKSHLILLDIGATTGEVPLNLLQPALEASSLQEDPELQDIWANLLANAANAAHTHHVEPSFVRILRELSSREVRFLESLAHAVAGVHSMQFDEPSLKRQYDQAGLSAAGENGFVVMMDILEGNRILRRIDYQAMEVRTLSSGRTNAPVGRIPNMEYYCFTGLGIAFVQACRKPKAN